MSSVFLAARIAAHIAGSPYRDGQFAGVWDAILVEHFCRSGLLSKPIKPPQSGRSNTSGLTFCCQIPAKTLFEICSLRETARTLREHAIRVSVHRGGR
ncbi:MAG: hypothetical protein LBD85_04350 [Oscillospiraceae bacterium]|nr:hypothetical protein [Oscillospiraceae bacterium]